MEELLIQIQLGGDKNFRQSGTDGERGENCGLVNIHNDLVVYAYGGSGASGGKYTTSGFSSGTGGRRLSCCTELVGGGARSEVGADHMHGAGGFSAGSNEQVNNVNQSCNGTWDDMTPRGVNFPGGAYYSSAYSPRIGSFNGHDITLAEQYNIGGRGRMCWI